MIPETDEVLVNRNGTTYKTTAENMANLEDTDLMLVNRDGVTYTVTGEEIKDSIQAEEAPDITSVVLTQNQVNADRYTSNQFTSTVNYAKDPFPPASIQMTAKVEGVLGLEASTSDIISNDYVGTSSTSVPLELANNTFLNDGTFEVGDVVKASESYTPETDTISSSTENEFTVSYSMKRWVDDFTPGSDQSTNWQPFASQPYGLLNNTGIEFTPGFPVKAGEVLSVKGAYESGNNMLIRVYFDDGTNTYMTGALAQTNWNNPSGFQNVQLPASTSDRIVIGINPETNPFTTNGDNINVGLESLKIDGQFIGSTTFGSGLTLAFLTEKDIKLFQVDDVVQSNFYESQEWSADNDGNDKPAESWENSFNGQIVTNGTGCTVAQDSQATMLTLPVEVPFTKLEVFGNDNDAAGATRLYYSDTEYVTTWTKIPTGSGNNVGWGDVTSAFDGKPKVLKKVYVSNNYNTDPSRVGGFKVDGNLLIDKSVSSVADVKVIATDVSAKTITVDGGTWDTSNQSQVWSNTIVGTAFPTNANVGPVTNLFDGDLNTYTAANTNTSCSWTAPANSTYKIYFGKDSGAAPLKINGVDYNGSSPATGSNLSTVEWATSSSNQWVKVSAIELDGKILIDAVNDSQVWSSGGGTDPDGGLVTTNVFDGNLTTYISSRPENTVITLGDGTTGVVANTSVRFYGAYQDPTNARYTVNGTQTNAVPLAFVDNSTFGWSEVTNDIYPLTITTVGVTGTGSGAGGRFVAVEVDGKLLVDQGARDLGDNKVSTVSPKQGQGTISDITDSVVTIDPYTDNCFKEGQYLTHATPKPILITPQTDEITDVTGDVLTFSGNKDLLNFAAGDAVSMVNADGSAATYSATTSAITTVDLQSITGSSSGFTSGGANLYNGTGGTASTSNGSGTRAGSISFNPALPAGTSQISYYEYNGSSSSTRPMTVTISYDDATSDVINTQISAGNTRVHPVDSAKQIKSIGWSAEVANESLNINQLKLGPNVIDLSDYDQTVLTFTDNTNLQYWKDGEVVGGYQGTISGTNSVGTGIFNFATFPYENKTYTQIFDPPVPCTSFQFRARPTDGQDSMESKISINGGGFTSIQQGDIQTNYNVPSGLTSLTYKFGVQAGNTHFGPGFGQLRFDGGDLDDIVIVDSTTFTWKVVTVIGTPDLVNNTITVSGGSWSNGDTLTKSISGTGTVLTTNPQNSTMTLSANNEEWVDGYYVQTPERPAIGQIGYLEFGSNGNVTGVTLAPQPAVVMANPNPVLTFPAQFGTGETPDTELPYPTSLQTTITASNTFIDLTVNSSTASSNVLFPATTTFLGPASGTSRYTGTGVAQLTANLTTFSGREAAANTDPTDVQGALAAKQTEIDDYIAGL